MTTSINSYVMYNKTAYLSVTRGTYTVHWCSYRSLCLIDFFLIKNIFKHPDSCQQNPGADPGVARGARPPKIGKNKICWRKIVIFHTKYPKQIRAPLRSCAPLTWNSGSAPDSIRLMSTAAVLPLSSAEVERVFS